MHPLWAQVAQVAATLKKRNRKPDPRRGHERSRGRPPRRIKAPAEELAVESDSGAHPARAPNAASPLCFFLRDLSRVLFDPGCTVQL